MSEPSQSYSGFIAMAIAAVVLAAAAFALYSVFSALDEQRAATAATNLRIAAMSVAAADAVAVGGGTLDIPELDLSVSELNGDPSDALSGLDGEQAATARTLIDEIASCGAWLIDPDGSEHPPHDHAQLQALLASASRAADRRAVGAERQALLAVVGALLVAGLGAWLQMSSFQRRKRRRAEAAAQARAGRRLESLLNDSPEVFLVIDAHERVIYRSASADSFLEPDVDAGAIASLAAADQREELRQHLRSSDVGGASRIFDLDCGGGDRRWFDVRVSDLSDDELVGGHVVTMRDVTGEVQLRQELRHQAHTDLLTGLPNRRVLESAISDAEAVMRARGSSMAVMTLDIDGFKAINDTLGHLAGDRALTMIGARLSRTLSDDEVLLRLGGDEFALVIPDVGGEAAAQAKAERLLAVLDDPIQLGDRTERIRASLGVAVTDSPERVSALLGEADIALYEAKAKSGSTAVLYRHELDATATRAARIGRALQAADYDAEMTLAYQPIVSARDGRVVGIEALLRWSSPELGPIGPDEFIPVAEASGDICAIGMWVLDEVCDQTAAWSKRGLDPRVTVSFNVSPRQLAHEDFVPGVLSAAERHGVPPERLVVEVTETTALDPSGLAMRRLERLSEAGLSISIDDFGSGYSNLGQLLRVPFDVIKIDRSLLLMLSEMREQAGGDPTDPCSIMEAIVSIAGTLGAPVVCEGVETEEQLASLRSSGIDYVQGYLTGRPIPAAEFELPIAATDAVEVGG